MVFFVFCLDKRQIKETFVQSEYLQVKVHAHVYVVARIFFVKIVCALCFRHSPEEIKNDVTSLNCQLKQFVVQLSSAHPNITDIFHMFLEVSCILRLFPFPKDTSYLVFVGIVVHFMLILGRFRG